MLIRGLCELSQVTGQARWREASEAALADVDRALRRGPLFAHQAQAGAREPEGFFLSDQVEMIAALDALAALNTEHAVEWTQAADQTLEATRALLEDRERGGFHARSAQFGARGVFGDPLKPVRENASMARLLLRRGQRNDDAALREAALRTLRSLAQERVIAAEGRNIGDYLLALEQASAPHVMLSVVGPAADLRTKALLERARALFLPQGIVAHFEPGTGHYPYPERPAVYLCSDAACSGPIFESEALKSSVQSFVADAS
ncbi:MAG: hypothetical protein QM778_03620 [Myxococcales bacterium]